TAAIPTGELRIQRDNRRAIFQCGRADVLRLRDGAQNTGRQRIMPLQADPLPAETLVAFEAEREQHGRDLPDFAHPLQRRLQARARVAAPASRGQTGDAAKPSHRYNDLRAEMNPVVYDRDGRLQARLVEHADGAYRLIILLRELPPPAHLAVAALERLRPDVVLQFQLFPGQNTDFHGSPCLLLVFAQLSVGRTLKYPSGRRYAPSVLADASVFTVFSFVYR